MKIVNGNGLWGRLRVGLLFLVLFGMGETALAAAESAAANAIIQNVVTVNYQNSGGVAQTAVTASAQVTIEFVEVAPEVAYLTGQSTPTDLSLIAENQSVTLRYAVTTQANGPDTYQLDISETAASLNASTLTDPTSVGSLGATNVGPGSVASFTSGDCLAPGGGTCSLKVPTDLLADTSVNGIAAAAERVKIEAASDLYCDVDSITDAGGPGVVYNPGTTESEIIVSSCTPDFAGATTTAGPVTVEVGDGIYEAKTVDVVVGITTLTAAPTSGTSDISVIGQDTAPIANSSGSVAAPTITVVASQLEVRKYVRNVDDGGQVGTSGAAGDVLNLNAVLYYRAGITAAPGETLEYAILISNVGAASVLNVQATDALPPFTNYTVTTGAALTDGIILYAEEDLDENNCSTGNTCVVTTPLTSTATSNADDTLATGSDHGGVSGSDLQIYAGTSADESNGATGGGTVAADKATIVTYRVVVD